MVSALGVDSFVLLFILFNTLSRAPGYVGSRLGESGIAMGMLLDFADAPIQSEYARLCAVGCIAPHLYYMEPLLASLPRRLAGMGGGKWVCQVDKKCGPDKRQLCSERALSRCARKGK